MTASTTRGNFIKKSRHTVLPIVFWLGVWQLASMMVKQELFLASPWVTCKTLLALLGQAAFWRSILLSTTRIMSGFFLAVAVAALLAVAASFSQWVRRLLSPLMAIIKSVPVASFVILVIIWAGSHNLSIVISFLMVLPILYSNLLAGIMACDHELLEMSKVFRISWPKQVFYLYLPQLMPFVLSACSLALGLAWKSGIAAEVIGIADGSMGELLYESKIYLNTAELFAVTVVIVAMSFLFEKLFLWLLRTAQQQIERRYGS